MIKLDSLRQEIDQIDREILDLASKRLKLVEKIGEFKIKLQAPVRDFAREKQCIEQAQKHGKSVGLSASFVKRLLEDLIRESLKTQEQERITSKNSYRGKSALIIGGAGKMGSWFGRFLSSQGFHVEIEDLLPSPDGFPPRSATNHDLIVVATPMSVSNNILLGLAQTHPKGIVFDLASLKEPVRPGLEALINAGVKACSLHPMFGPDTELLSGKHIILVDLGNMEANQAASALFAPTMANLIAMNLNDHDKVVGFLLGLSHALNIAFFTALAKSGESAPRLKELSSTTFEAQVEVAKRVAQENPYLYYEIQALNPYSDIPLGLLSDSIEQIRQIIKTRDESAFVKLMNQGNSYFFSTVN